jgi:hypothetical protein
MYVPDNASVTQEARANTENRGTAPVRTRRVVRAGPLRTVGRRA